MRALARFASGAAFVAALSLVATTALAKPKKKPVEDDSVAVTADQKKGFVVLTDGEGSVIVVDKTWNSDQHSVFFGDGKTMYEQRVFGGGADGGAGTWSYSFWSPRVNRASFSLEAGGKYVLECGDQNEDWKKVPDADARKLLDAAIWKKALWRRQAQFLARDDHGNYYYVDRLRDDFGGKGHRIFAGPKGGMKELPMTNVVADSKGEIYATKRGELRFITATDAASWVNGGTRTELTIVPVEDNVPMIYRDLGVYEGSLGTPCDDM
jgi:hypothetical protein